MLQMFRIDVINDLTIKTLDQSLKTKSSKFIRVTDLRYSSIRLRISWNLSFKLLVAKREIKLN